MRKKIFFSILVLSMAILVGCSSSEGANSPLIGTTAPDFRLENIEGGHTSLSDYNGTPVLLYFHMAIG